MPNSDIGGSGVATYSIDGFSSHWHSRTSSSLSAGAPTSFFDLVGIGVPVTTSSSRELSTHWSCVVLRSPSPCPYYQPEHFDSAPWTRPTATPRGRVPKRCIGGSGTSTDPGVSSCSSSFFYAGTKMLLPSSFAQRRPASLVSPRGQPTMQSILSLFPRAWSCSCKLRGGASLSLLSTFGACRLLLTAWAPFTPIQSPWHPLGGLVLLPIKGIPLGLLRPAAVWSVSQGAIAAQILPLPGERRPRQRVHRTSPLRSGLITPFRIWFWCGLLPSLPRQVWAAPRPFGRTLIG